jgi:hypothetical protein
MTLDDKIHDALMRALASASALSIRISRTREFFPGGTNGPHGALETPVRNTCHWIVALLRGFHFCAERSLFDRAMRLRAWLLDAGNPFSHYPTFRMRSAEGTDAVNGVIGAAWLLEALHELVVATGDEEARKRGTDLLAAHPFDRVLAWRRHDPITNRHSVDYTYDHQAWLAAAIADWGGARALDARSFLDALHRGALETRADGRIAHLYRANGPKAIALRARYELNERRRPGSREELECGYHLYSLLPLARLRRHFASHPFFTGETLGSALSYCTTERMLRLRTNRFGYAYNAPGLELPIVFRAFSPRLPLDVEDVAAVMDDQARVTMDPATGLHTRNTPDPLTLSARIYELALALDESAAKAQEPVPGPGVVCAE